MKCFNCNNEIPDASIVCPFCNAKIEQSTKVIASNNDLQANVLPNEVNTNSMGVSTSGLPVTPTTPVLPTDQDLVVNTEKSETVSDTKAMVEPTNSVELSNSQNQGSSQNQGNSQKPISESVAPAPVKQVTPVVNTPLQNGINPEYIAPSGEVIDGVKIDSTIQVPKKKNKTKLIIIIVIFVFLLIVGGIGGFYYYSQYQTSSKRISEVFNGITNVTNSLRNESIDQMSGAYNLDLELNYNDNSFTSKINGKYAFHLSGKAFDLTTNIEELKNKEDLINAPINLEFYYNESKIYLLLENLYDQYIYEEWGFIEPYLDSISKNEISYVTLINSLKRATRDSLSKLANNQSVRTVNIHGESKKVNAITIRLNAHNQMIFYNNFYRILANDKTFLTELSKLIDKNVEQLAEELTEKTTNTDYEDLNTIVEVYTAMFKSEFEGLKITKQDNKVNHLLEVYPSGKGYGISYSQDSQSIFEGTYDLTKKNTSTTKEKLYNIEFSVYINNVAYKVKASLNIIGDVNPKDANVNVKNSVNKMYLSEIDKNTILTKYNELGSIALEYPDLMKDYLGITDPILPPVDNCSPGMNCQNQVIEGN